MAPSVINIFHRGSTSKPRNTGGGRVASPPGSGNNTGGNNNTDNPWSSGHQTVRIQALEARIEELCDLCEAQNQENGRLSLIISGMEIAKTKQRVQQTMREADLMHRLNVKEQQLWLAQNVGRNPDDAETERGSTAVTAPSTILSDKPSVATSSTLPDESTSPSAVFASLNAERTRRVELESQVARLRVQLNDERRCASTRNKEHATQQEQFTEQLVAKDVVVAARDAELYRVTALLSDKNNASLQRAADLERQIAEAAARHQTETEAQASRLAAQVRAVEDLRLQKNIQSTACATAERKVQRLQDEVAQRGAQLEYYQQRLLRTAEFRLVKTPFEVEEAIPMAPRGPHPPPGATALPKEVSANPSSMGPESSPSSPSSPSTPSTAKSILPVET
ncbi:hypothetical protein SPBR_08526 [Sporothrix brasiliensis 5110]|uniref:Uncharacterized protein n=1 Tax=Sporothrix brasiliensis 5110 TaxID=1398154 RepID=A0A0C2F778_9PEZI|nr:uncharacterized protein SPBR_08526 [Sporothrix brasiliensis 5110]KIH86903.1 hypothetical protein SPBR_08526 [Sporothrix brasiliensis 5110]